MQSDSIEKHTIKPFIIVHLESQFLSSKLRPKKRNCLFPVTVRKKIGLVNGKKCFCINYFGQKCVFYACLSLIRSWEGGKNFRVGIFLNKNLLG